jgi:hypothetical protein
MAQLDSGVRDNHVGDDSTTNFAYTYLVNDASELVPYLDNVKQTTGFTVNDVGTPAGGTVDFAVAPGTGVKIVLIRETEEDQQATYTEYGPFFVKSVEAALNKLTRIAQEHTEQLGRSIRSNISSGVVSWLLPEPSADRGLKWNASGDALENTTGNPDEIVDDAAASAAAAAASEANAATSEANAATSESNAATSESNASSSAAAAASSETAAANAVAGVPFNDVIRISSVITLDDGERGVLVEVDATGGPIDLPLALLSSLTTPYTVVVKKIDTSGNAVSSTANIADELNGVAGGSVSTQVAQGGFTIVADTDASPGGWTTTTFGPIGGNMTNDAWDADVVEADPSGGTPGKFIPGTSKVFNLTVAPGSENNTWVYFNGVKVDQDQYDIVGSTLTFSSPVIAGTTQVRITIGTVLSIGTPADETVSAAKIAASDVVAIWNKIFGGAIAKTWSAIQTFSGGIKFGGGGDTLNHYEEGTWTARIYDEGVGGNQSSTTVTGNYTVTGNICHCSFSALNDISTAGLTAGNNVFVGLPKIAARRSCGPVITDGITYPAGRTAVVSRVSAGQQRAQIVATIDSSNDSPVLVSGITSGVDDIADFQLTYQI